MKKQIMTAFIINVLIYSSINRCKVTDDVWLPIEKSSPSINPHTLPVEENKILESELTEEIDARE